LAFVSQGQWGGIAFARERVQPRAQGGQGHDTKRSDWRDPDRLKPGRRHKKQPHDHAKPKTSNDSISPTDVFKELCSSEDALGQAASTMHQSDIRGLGISMGNELPILPLLGRVAGL